MLTSSDSGRAVDHPVLITPLSLDPRDSSPVDSSAEDSTTSTRTCQEPPVPPPTHRSQTTTGTASSDVFPHFSHTVKCFLPGTSRLPRHEYLTATDTLTGPRHHRSPPPPHALGHRSYPNDGLPDNDPRHPSLPPPTPHDPELLPNPLLARPFLDIFSGVSFDVHHQQRAQKLRGEIHDYDAGDGQPLR